MPLSNNDGQTETVGQAVLQSFSATPPSIGPFGETVLQWSVSAPPGVRVMLNNEQVGHSGSRTEQPRVDGVYHLEAQAGIARKPLGTVSVKVDNATCAAVPATLDVRTTIPKLILNGVLDANKSLTQQTQRVSKPDRTATMEPVPPTIAFSRGRITVKLFLTAHVGRLSPDVDVTLETGLRLDESGTLLAVDPRASGAVTDSWLLDLVPVLGLIVHLKDGAAQDRLPMQFAPAVAAIPGLVSLVYPIDASRQRYQTVWIPGDPAEPPIQLVACAKPRSVHGIPDAGGVQVVRPRDG